jgi:hypothetical protein
MEYIPLVVAIICVFIFLVTAVITLLHISGARLLPNADYGNKLFVVLIIEVAIVSIASFSNVLSNDGKVASDSQDKKFAQASEDKKFAQASEDKKLAKASAEKIIDLINVGKLMDVHSFHSSSYLRQKLADDISIGMAFFASTGTLIEKELICETTKAGVSYSQDGPIYVFKYLNKYENAVFMEEISLVEEGEKNFSLIHLTRDKVGGNLAIKGVRN